MKRALLICLAVVSVTASAIAQRPTFTTTVNPTTITSGSRVGISAVISDVTQVPLATRACYFAVGTSVVANRQFGRVVNPIILYSIQNFQPLRGTAVGARTVIRVPRLPRNIRMAVYFQEFTVIKSGRGVKVYASDIARALVRT